MTIVRRAIDIDVSRFLTKLARKQVDWNNGVRRELVVPPLLFRYHHHCNSPVYSNLACLCYFTSLWYFIMLAKVRVHWSNVKRKKNRIKKSCACKGIAKDYSVCICSDPAIGSIGDTCQTLGHPDHPAYPGHPGHPSHPGHPYHLGLPDQACNLQSYPQQLKVYEGNILIWMSNLWRKGKHRCLYWLSY